MNHELIAHIEYLKDKDMRFKVIEERYLIAVSRYFMCGGELPSHQIANYLGLNNHRLTLMIQDKMAQMTGVELKNNAPKVNIYNSLKDLEYKSPRSYRYEWQPVYELDYYNYLANNSREQIIHNYKLYLHESRSRNLQGNSKVSNTQAPKGNIQI